MKILGPKKCKTSIPFYIENCMKKQTVIYPKAPTIYDKYLLVSENKPSKNVFEDSSQWMLPVIELL